MSKVNIPIACEKITMTGRKLNVPDNPIIPFIEGDGIGPDIWSATVKVLDAVIEKTYNNISIQWLEVFAGDKANDV